MSGPALWGYIEASGLKQGIGFAAHSGLMWFRSRVQM